MKASKTDAMVAAVHFDAIQAHAQALHHLDIGEANIRGVIQGQKVFASIREDADNRAGIRPDPHSTKTNRDFKKLLWPRSEWRHL